MFSKKVFLIVSFFYLFATLFCSCSKEDIYIAPKRQVSDHIDKTAELEEQKVLELINPSGNLVIFRSEEAEVKFEIKKRLRGNEPEEELLALMDLIDYKIVKDKNKLTMECVYPKDINPIDNLTDVIVYVPSGISDIKLNVGVGTVRMHDDFRCSLSMNIGTANVYIDKLIGEAKIRCDMGNVYIFEGNLSAGSSIITGMGNITVKADFDHQGRYVFETGLGNINLEVPEGKELSFESIGEIKSNSLPESDGPANIKLKTAMGEIFVKRY